MLHKNVFFFILLSLSISLSCSKKDTSCEPGYTGAGCTEQIEPIAIKIKSVSIISWPSSNGGISWDPFDAPDLYFELNDNSHQLLSTESEPLSNYSFSSYKWDYSLISPSMYPKLRYSIKLYDFDTFGGPQYMGGVEFSPYSSTNKFPSTINVGCSACNTSWQIEVEYIR